MNITVAQEALKLAIARACAAVAGKPALPVLSHLLLEATPGRLILKATDLEVSIVTWAPAQVISEGAICLPAKLLADVVGGLPNDQISLTLDAHTQTTRLACGTSVSSIRGIEAEEFPTIPTLSDSEPAAILPAKLLHELLAQVAPCAAADDTRPVLAGVLLRLRDGSLTLAAADGFRLARCCTPIPTLTMAGEHIAPAKALRKLAKALGSEGDVALRFSRGGGHVAFASEAAILVARQIDGKFPDFERIIPKAYRTRSVLDTAELARAVKLASYFASSSQNVVRLTMTPGGDVTTGRLQLSANAVEVGDNTGDLNGAVEGEGGPIALNVHYLAEALEMLGSDQVVIETQTPQAPAVLRPVGSDAAYLHIIMPMSLR
jgi:DNA polymerase-3 subunit beta